MLDITTRLALERNLKIFVWFRALFNARFYYPVFAVFFTDLGLSISQFLWLNVIWALTIVLFEVPSGVLADIVGRRKLVIFSASSMVIEMFLLIIAPQHGGWALFVICAINRMLSGLAEAAASGADEALAYDSLKMISAEDDIIENKWDDTLVSSMRWRSFAGVIAMLVGGFVFDHTRMEIVFGDLPRTLSLKLPVILCFITACVCVGLAFCLIEPSAIKQNEHKSVRGLGRGILDAARWVFLTKWLAVLMIAAVMIDAVSRTFVTLISEYFRWIDLPEYSFGIIGAAMFMGGAIVPVYVRPLVARFSPRVNMLIAGGIGVFGLTGVSLLHGIAGVIACLIVMVSLVHVGFLLSRYINREAPSEKRASILSVNNLSLSIGYGLFSMLYALRLNQVEFGTALSGMPIILSVGLFVWFILTRVMTVKSTIGDE